METLRFKRLFVLLIHFTSIITIKSDANIIKHNITCPFSKIIEDIFKIHNKTSDAGIFLKNSEQAKIFINSIRHVTNETSNKSNDDIVNDIIASINMIKNNITIANKSNNNLESRLNEAIILDIPMKEDNLTETKYNLTNDNQNKISQSDSDNFTNYDGKIDTTEKPTYVEILTIEPNNTSSTNSNTTQHNILEVLKQLMPIFNNNTMKELHNITIIETNFNKNHSFSTTKNISTIVVTYCDKNFTKANISFDSNETDLKISEADSKLDRKDDDEYFEGIDDADDEYDDEMDGNLTVGEKRSILEATEYGMEKMHQLYSVIEPKLYHMGYWLEESNPARIVAAFSAPDSETEKLSRYGHASLEAARRLQQIISDDNGSGEGQEGRMETSFPAASALRRTPLLRQCPLKGDPKCPPASKRYRTHDGTCNNMHHPRWGSTKTPVQRFLQPSYSDNLQAPRVSIFGGSLPSAREISSFVHEDQHAENSGITHLLMQWGQFLDHDVTSSSQSRGFNGSVPRCCKDGGKDFVPKDVMHPECMPISVPPSDPFYGPQGVRCLDFVRSSPAPREDCALGWREQMNQVSAYIDASPLYASSAKQSVKLRLFRNGMLQYGRVQQRRPLLPPERKDELCRGGAVSTDCFKSGDGRVNEHPGLVAAHIIWLRQHNRMAQELAHLNPHWSDEKIYLETRKIVGAMVQHITYKEFLPIVLGPDVMRLFELEPLQKGYYRGYDPKINPSPASSFSSAAFRFGHSLVQPSMVRYDRFHRPLDNNVSLHDELTNPSNIWSIGAVDRLLLGMINQPIQNRDEFITEELTNHLFQTPTFTFGMDLAAINIQRGRDHGVPPYTAWREPCGLSPITEFEDLNRVMPRRVVRKLKILYKSVNDIDLYTGGLGERPVVGGLVGPTFACIIAQQFSNLRKGDRFWYENGGAESSLTPAQLQQIRHISIAQVLCRTLDTIDNIQPFAFLSPNPDNERISCQNGLLNNFELTPWTEQISETINDIRKSDKDDFASTTVKVRRPIQTTTRPRTTTRNTQTLLGASSNVISQNMPAPLDPKNPTKINDINKVQTVTKLTEIDDKLDFRLKSRHDDTDTERNNFKYDFNRKQYDTDYEYEDDNVQTVQAVVINNSPHKRPNKNHHNNNQHNYNYDNTHNPHNYNQNQNNRPTNHKRPVISVTENIDKYTYLINYVPRPTESWRQTTRKTDRDVVKVTYQKYDDTYKRPQRPYYYDNNRHEDYDKDNYDRRDAIETDGDDSLKFSARSNEDTTIDLDSTDKQRKIDRATENYHKLVTFTYLGTYKGDMTDEKLSTFRPDDNNVKSGNNVRRDTISKDFSTYTTKDTGKLSMTAHRKQGMTEHKKQDMTDRSTEKIDNVDKLSTFFLYETVTKPYRHRPTRFNDDQILHSHGDSSKYYYVKNVLQKYPEKIDEKSALTHEVENDLTDKTTDIIRENYNSPGVPIHEEDLQERSSLDKLAFLEDMEKSANQGGSRKKIKKPGPAKTPSVAFDVIPSEISPTQWKVYEERYLPEDGLLRQMPSIKAAPDALEEVPRPMNFAGLRKRRPGIF